MKKLRILIIPIILLLGMGAIIENNDRYFDIIKNIEIFSNVYKELNTNYVDDLDPSQLMKKGIDAMVNSLDPYTNYISESQIESYRISSEGGYNGLGAQSRMIDGWVTIVELYEGGAAKNAGMKVGDQITAINGNSTKGRSNEEVIEFLRGFPGSEVALTVDRPGSEKQVLKIKRGEVNIPNVPFSAEVGDGVGYIALTTFTPKAGQNVADALKQLKRSNEELKGVILDLRGNGGGLLMEALNVSNVFIPRGKEVVTTKGKIKDRDQIFRTRNEHTDLEIPLVVLINKRSASASEIVSGVIQDYDRGLIVGQRSYGKGLVQNTLEVGYNSRLKVTTSKYYIPSGRCIQSVEYENGEPKDIADSERAVFYTNNGRPVLDGGGVTPDYKLEEPQKPAIITALEKDNWIFKYVTEYCLKNDSIAPVESYSFNAYKDFTKYLEKNKFEFETQSEKMLADVEAKAKDEKFDAKLNNYFEQIKKSIAKSKEDDLVEFESLITNQIEMEIASRYYYQQGKVKQRLKNDAEIDEAVGLLNDSDKFEKLLSGQ